MTLAYSFFPTRDELIAAALRRIRAFDPEDATTISTLQYTNGGMSLNYLLSAWQADGLHVWTIKTSSALTMIASQGAYTIAPASADFTLNRPLTIIQAWTRNTTSILDTPLDIITREKYNQLSGKTQEGTPTSLYYDATYETQGTNAKGTMYLWPEPNTAFVAANTLYLVYQRPLLDFAATGDQLDMPQEWYNAVRLNLALALGPEYGMPVIEYDRLAKEAKDAKDLAMGWDREKGSLFIQPRESGYDSWGH